MSLRASKLDACFTARVYDAGPDTLTAKILSFAARGWGSAKRKTCINEREKYPLDQDKGNAGPYGGRGKRQGSNASKIRNAGPRMDTFLTISEGDRSQRGIKRKLLLWRVGCILGRLQMCLGCSEYTKATRNHLVAAT